MSISPTDPKVLIHASYVRVTGERRCEVRGRVRLGAVQPGQVLEFSTVDGAHHRLNVASTHSGDRFEELVLEGDGVSDLVPGVFLTGF